MAEIALTDTAQYQDETIQNLQAYALLTNLQKKVLVIMLEHLESDLDMSDAAIAARAECHPDTVRNCRYNAHFLTCLSEATRNIMKSQAPQVVKALKKNALEGSVRAQDLFIRYTGDYIPKQQIESKSQNLNISAKINAVDAIGEFVALLCDKGWNKERIINEIDQVYDQLKEQGRIV